VHETEKVIHMNTIALRFSNNFAPPIGTIAAHQDILALKGFVWYGKLGSTISTQVADMILKNDDPRILLIHSGSIGRYWAYVDAIQREVPPLADIPEYYRHMVKDFKTWFRVNKFENAHQNILTQCKVASSGKVLSDASRHSMSPYFIIKVEDDD